MENKPALSPNIVNEFVAQAHGDLNRVKEFLEQEPMLINAAWNWGGGDWETALGAAAHMGRKDIALYLLEQGARIDIFAAAMLGHIEIVRVVIQAFPDTLNVPGPHGIPLIAHAKAGGEGAVAVQNYLQSLHNT
jgi:hypothetical protein